jgi:hypothetical protein
MKQNVSFVPTRTHLVRLMKIYRSAGWPSRDALEIDLVGADLIRVSVANTGHETVCLTDAGVKVLVEARRHDGRSSTSHDRLAQRMAQHLMASGRVVWRELSFRAQSSHRAESEGGSTPVDGALPFAPTCGWRRTLQRTRAVGVLLGRMFFRSGIRRLKTTCTPWCTRLNSVEPISCVIFATRPNARPISGCAASVSTSFRVAWQRCRRYRRNLAYGSCTARLKMAAWNWCGQPLTRRASYLLRHG